MAFSRITNEDTKDKGVTGLPAVPALETSAMQKKFDELSTDVLIPKFNALVDELEGESSAGSLGVNVPEGAEVNPNIQAFLDWLYADSKRIADNTDGYMRRIRKLTTEDNLDEVFDSGYYYCDIGDFPQGIPEELQESATLLDIRVENYGGSTRQTIVLSGDSEGVKAFTRRFVEEWESWSSLVHSAREAQKLAIPRMIQGELFDGSEDITVVEEMSYEETLALLEEEEEDVQSS